MSYTRHAKPLDEFGTLIGCSVCGFPYHYPDEIRLHSDKKWRCLRTCNDPTNWEESERKRAASHAAVKERNIVIPNAIGVGYR